MFDFMPSDARSASSRTLPLQRMLQGGRNRPMALYTPSGRIVQANRRFLQLVGARHVDICGQRHRVFVAPGPTAASRPEVDWDLLALGAPIVAEFRRRTLQGRPFSALEAYIPLETQSGEVGHVLAVVISANGVEGRPTVACACESDGAVLG